MITLSVKAGQPHRTESAKKLAAKAVILIEVPPVFRTADPLGFSAERTGDNVEGISEILAGIP